MPNLLHPFRELTQFRDISLAEEACRIQRLPTQLHPPVYLSKNQPSLQYPPLQKVKLQVRNESKGSRVPKPCLLKLWPLGAGRLH